MGNHTSFSGVVNMTILRIVAYMCGRRLWRSTSRISRNSISPRTDPCGTPHKMTGWRIGVAVTRWSRSTQLLYIEPG